MNHLDEIKTEIEKALGELTNQKINFTVDIPELEHGDVTSNVCLVASKILKMSPQEVFEKIGPHLTSPYMGGMVQDVQFKNPGFINFWLKKEFIRKGGTIKNHSNPFFDIVNYFFGGKTDFKKFDGQKILVEHTSVNLFKPFTIGHLMSNFIGEFVKRIHQEFGANVVNLSYPSDISLGIAKAIFVIKKNGGLKDEHFNKDQKEIVTYLGECYRNGVALYKEAEADSIQGSDVIREVKDIANNLYQNISGEDLEIYNLTKKINLDYFASVLAMLDSKFDNLIFESEAGVVGKKLVEENIGEVFQKSEGAIIYIPDESRKDINTTVFINSEDNPTYAAKDIGLIKIKSERFKFDKNYYVVDNEQIPHFKVVFDAAEKIFPELKNKNQQIVHGRMTFKGQKMSSRLGGVPSGEEVIENILEEVKSTSAKATVDKGKISLTEEELREIALSALRISILRAKPGVNIDFDPEKALSFEGDSGPYLCYTSARLHSLLQKGKENNLFPGCQLAHDGPERKLERKIFQFNSVLENVVEEIAPQKLVTYMFELTGEFNNFYAHTKIISENKDDKFESEHYLYVVQKTLNVLTKGLYILGINAPERM